MRLHSGAPFWLVADGLRELGTIAPPPAKADVVVIGAGITGALVADALTAAGASVVVLDRRAPACGSTAASTSLLTYELDISLKDLGNRIGLEDAVRAYRVSQNAIDDLARIADSLSEGVGLARRSSLCLATQRRHSRVLEQEVVLRQEHGIDAEFWEAQEVERRHGFPSYGALHTRVAGVLDPIRFTRALLGRATDRGAVLLGRTPAIEVQFEGTHAAVITGRGRIRASRVVYAMGYELPPPLRSGLVKLSSTYALTTEPLDDLGPWQGDCIVWETARPYAYMRTTADRRVMIGGADVPFKDAAARDRLMPARSRLLERKLRQWLPGIEMETAFVWAGTFGESRDSLPYIGPWSHGDCPQALFALGYGANGITFGAVAARIITDLCSGRPSPDAELFRLDRSS